MGKPTIVQGEGVTLVIGACSHDNEQTTIGPTTDQINHWCSDCRTSWTTWPDRPAVMGAAPAVPAAGVGSLHAAIMNLPCYPPQADEWGKRCYARGHRDARHAAAELVSAALSAAPGPDGVMGAAK